jgi:peptidyl-prolyl cis-trans isomerase A (cyclophilin A)
LADARLKVLVFSIAAWVHRSMIIRFALLISAFATAPLLAQSAPPAAVEAPKEDLVRVALETEAGRIVLALDRRRAPVTTANFLRYVDSKRFDGVTFYRAMKLWEGTGLVQAGVRDGAKLYPAIAHEPTSQTGIKHEDGTVSMARQEPGSARADFFITIGKVEGFDANSGQQGDDFGYAAFGRVVEGMDVVRKLLAAPVSATKGEKDGMKGQIMEPPVKITTARRLPD